jgi:Na+/proline symporter
VIFELVQRILPPNLAALPVLVVFSAVIVAMGAQLLAVADALVLLTVRPGTDAPSVGRLRTVVFLTGLAAASIAAFVSLGSARVALLCWLATAAVLGPLFLVRAAGVQIRPGYAAAAMRVGIVLTLVLFLLRRERAEWMAAFVPFAIALLIAIVGRERGRRATS